jgi:hypothetical protein
MKTKNASWRLQSGKAKALYIFSFGMARARCGLQSLSYLLLYC